MYVINELILEEKRREDRTREREMLRKRSKRKKKIKLIMNSLTIFFNFIIHNCQPINLKHLEATAAKTQDWKLTSISNDST